MLYKLYSKDIRRIHKVNRNSDPDMSRKAIESYVLNYPDIMEGEHCKKSYRGDTLNSVGWTFGRQTNGKFNVRLCTYSRFFTQNKRLKSLIHFMKIIIVLVTMQPFQEI